MSPRSITPSATGVLSPTSGCLSVEALCREWNITPRTVGRWVKADPVSGVTVPLPHHRVGRRLFFIASEIQEWLRRYGPNGECRLEDAAGDDPVVPSAKIKRRARAGKGGGR